MKNIGQIREILKGNTRMVCEKLLSEMKSLSEEMRCEEAQAIKVKYDLAVDFCEKSEVIAHSYHNMDVFSIVDDEDSAFINFLHITNGCINQTYTFEYKKKIQNYTYRF